MACDIGGRQECNSLARTAGRRSSSAEGREQPSRSAVVRGLEQVYETLAIIGGRWNALRLSKVETRVAM